MRIIFFISLLFLPIGSYAIDEGTCRNGAFPTYSNFTTAEISAGDGQQVHFRNDREGCPEQSKCVTKAYLVNGDKILIAHRAEGWVCTWFFGKKREYVGWIPEANVRRLPFSTSPAPEDWLGNWETALGDNSVTISTSNNNMLQVAGKAVWHGGINNYNEEIIHFGEVNGTSSPSKNHMTVKEGDDKFECVVDFQLIGPYLISTDNGNCGGVNVRFQDVYRRKAPSDKH